MTRKEQIMRHVLSNRDLSDFGEYTHNDYEDYFDALESKNPIISSVAKLINGDYGNIITNADMKKVYQTMSTDLQTNLTL